MRDAIQILVESRPGNTGEHMWVASVSIISDGANVKLSAFGEKPEVARRNLARQMQNTFSALADALKDK